MAEKISESKISVAWVIYLIRGGRIKEIDTGAEQLHHGDSVTAEIKALRHSIFHTCNILGLINNYINYFIPNQGLEPR